MNKHIDTDVAWAGTANCAECQLRSSVLFSGLTEKDFETVHGPIDQLELKPGNFLYRAGDKAEFLYTIRKGMVKLVQYLPDGKQRIVRLLRTTDITGLEAVLHSDYQHDAIAIQGTEVCALPAKVVNQLAKNNAALHKELMNRWQRALNEADTWITQFSTGSAPQRVARLLLFHLCEQNEGKCLLPLREDIAAILGITTETASRTIADFKRQGVIFERAPQQFQIDAEKAKNLAE
ncbi:MAG: Crp/Fnr family transcriptional regulator [bacterium]